MIKHQKHNVTQLKNNSDAKKGKNVHLQKIFPDEARKNVLGFFSEYGRFFLVTALYIRLTTIVHNWMFGIYKI